MRALRLDYRADGKLFNLMGYLLLAMIVMVVAAVGWYFNQLRQETARVEGMVEKIEGQARGNLAASETSQMNPEKLAEVIKFSNKVIHQLNLPWDQLFVELEKARGDSVALLGVEPDANSASIKVIGEAKNYAAMLQYVRDLSDQGGLHGVYLAEHKMDEQNPDNPIRFILEATWAAK